MYASRCFQIQWRTFPATSTDRFDVLQFQQKVLLPALQLVCDHRMALSVYEPPSPVHVVDCLEQVQIKELAADGHLHLIEGILQDKVAVQIIDPAHGKNSMSPSHILPISMASNACSALQSPQTSVGNTWGHTSLEPQDVQHYVSNQCSKQVCLRSGGARVFEEDVHIRCVWLHHHQHFGACERLEAVQVEGVCLQQLYSCAARRRRQLRSNGMQGVPATWQFFL